MRVTREGDYGLRAVVYLATTAGRTVSAAEISKKQEIPPKFLVRIMPKLVRKGVVVSVYGSKGGYRLSRQPAQISFLEVLEAIEGPLVMNECLGEKCDCLHEHLCTMKNVWKNAQVKLMDYLGSVTFDQLREGIAR
ncbi:MAG: Rrf2 family transcriptional regulator [Deltaproteobacteria bacterium]|nr:Rrf2 family transcriptional regulator [Deltaproteobacteria bacterium]